MKYNLSSKNKNQETKDKKPTSILSKASNIYVRKCLFK